MKKVTTINLNGRAYQVEEEGYETLKAYLDKAEKTLAHNPDREDIVNDIEQAIADKCDAELTSGKNVVSARVVKGILEKVGPVHETDDYDDEKVEASTQQEQRKLYLLPKDGKIVGVCAGLAAYFGTDVTVMRLLFVVLTFVTQGFMILVYLILAIAMPEAKRPEEVAAAYGRPDTAKEIVGKMKQVATDKDNVARVGSVITTIAKVVANIAIALIVIGLVVLTGFLVAGVWAALLDELKMSGTLAVITPWKQIAFFGAVYVLLALPLFWLYRLFDSVSHPKRESGDNDSRVLNITTVVLWTIALFSVLTFGAIYGESISDFANRNDGYIKVGSNAICIDDSKCGTYYEWYEENGTRHVEGINPSQTPAVTGEWR